jgi:hypothetical protein
MRSIKFLAAPVALLLLAAPASARTPLTQDRADRAAATAARQDAAVVKELAVFDDPIVATTDLDPCDLLGSFRGECEGTFTYTDGVQCDFTVEIRITRRDKLGTNLEYTYCDNWPSTED